jgi:hypothetical protein
MSIMPNESRKGNLEQIARRAMQNFIFQTDFPQAALDELKNIQVVDWSATATKKDLRQF